MKSSPQSSDTSRPGTRRRIALVVALVVGLLATALAMAFPASVSTAAGLITSRDIKNGTIKKIDLSSKVRTRLDAPNDGPAVVMGRITNPGSVTPPSCLVGPPSGLSATIACNSSLFGQVSMPVPRTVVLRHLLVTVPNNASGGSFYLWHNNTNTLCSLPAGTLSCTIPPLHLSAGDLLNVELDWNSGTIPTVAFSYELWNPAAVPAGAVARGESARHTAATRATAR